MKTLLARWAWVKIVEGILLIILGLLVGIIGGIYSETLSQALSIVIAVFLFIDGGITLFALIVDPKKNFSLSIVFGALFIAIGVVLCSDAGQEAVKNILAIFVACMLLTVGGTYAFKAIVNIVYKGPVGWIIIHILIALAGLGLGITSLIYRDESLSVIYIVLGTALTVLGIFDIILAVDQMKKEKEKGPAKPEVVESEPFDASNNEIVEAKTKTRKRKKKEITSDETPKELTLNETATQTEETPVETVEAEIIDE